jgi:3-oxoacyl-[acyl-carrier-protein] synthase I
VKNRVVVVGVGARTPLGLTAQPTAMLYRAASVVMQHGPFVDGAGEPANICALPTLDPRVTGMTRAAELGLPAMGEAIAGLRGAGVKTKVVLCLDEHAADGRAGRISAPELVNGVERRASEIASALEVEVIARGGASLGLALEDVMVQLEKGTFGAAVVGGVHTDYDAARIDELWRAGRLFAGDRLDAVLPGECAAFAVLVRPGTAQAMRLPVRAEIHAVANAWAKARPDNDEPAFTAGGVTTVVKRVSEPLVEQGLRAGWLLSDMTFESLRLYEIMAMTTRTQKIWCEPQQWDAPAQRLGNLGAAAMPLHMVLAAEAWRTGWGPHPIALSLAGSDAGERAAVLMSAPGKETAESI